LTYEQYQAIVADVLAPAFNRVTQWTPEYHRNVVFQRIHRFSEDVARQAARILAQESRYVPRAIDWERECRRLAGNRPTSDAADAGKRADCPDCRNVGYLIFAVRVDPEGNRHIEGEIYDTQDYERLDRLDHWASLMIPCGCDWTPEGANPAPPDLRRRVLEALREFRKRVLNPMPKKPLVDILAWPVAKKISATEEEMPPMPEDGSFVGDGSETTEDIPF